MTYVVDNIIHDEKGIRFHYVVIYLLAWYVCGEAQAASDACGVRWATGQQLQTMDMHPLSCRAVAQAFAREIQAAR